MRSLALLLLLLSVACEQIAGVDEFMPDVQSVSNRFQDFILRETAKVTPIARYNDVDAMLASYCQTTRLDPLEEITAQATSRGWHVRERLPDGITFGRTTPGTTNSFEIVKIASAQNGCIAAAWVQLDSSAETVETSGELKWAKSQVWPRLETITNELRGHPQ